MKPILAKAINYMKPTIDPQTRLYVPFNEGTGELAKDYSQYGNHAVLTDVEWGIGLNGSAGVFNGVSSYGNCGNDASLNIIDAITIEAWVTFNSYDHPQLLICRGLSEVNGYYILSRAIHQLGFKVNQDGEAQEQLTSDNAFVINMPQYIAAVKNGSNAKIYINGEDKTGIPISLTNPASSTKNLYIGCYDDTTLNFNGTIVHATIKALAESAAQIAADCYEVVCSA